MSLSRTLQYAFIAIVTLSVGFSLYQWNASRASTVKLNATPTASLTSGLVGYWTFDGKDTPWSSSSAGTATDRSGNSNTGTLTNMSRATSPADGKLGQALNFDGTDDYIVAGNPSWYGTTWTWSAWVYLRQNPATTNGFTIINHGVGYNVNGAYMNVYNSGGTSKIYITEYTYQAVDTVAFPLNSWQLVTATRNGGTISLYRNATLVGTVADGGASVAPTGNMEIGRYTGATQYWPGLIDEVRIYNRALSAGEIQSLYDLGASDKVNSSVSQNQGTGRLDSGLAGYWPLDDGSGTNANDASTSNNDGTLIGGPTWVSGNLGQAVNFNGGQRIAVSTAPSLNLTGTLTLSAWVYKNTTGGCGNFDDVLSKADNNAGESNYELSTYGGCSGKDYIIFNYTNSGDHRVRGDTTLLSSSTWYHLVVVYNDVANKIDLYVNGILQTKTVLSGNPESNSLITNSQSLTIGARDSNYYAGFPGRIDEVRIYNRALSDDEVSQLYRLTAPTGVDTSLKGYWSFNGKDTNWTSSSAGTVSDLSGSGNTGTMTNMSRTTSPVEGKLGQALNFDGTDDFVQASNASSLQFANATPITLSAWVKPSQVAAYATFLIKGRDTNDSEGNYAFRQSSTGKLEFYYNESGNTNWHVWTTTSAVFSTANQWYHVAVTYTFGTGSSIRAYINGESVAGSWSSGTGNVAPDISTQKLMIGQITTGERFAGLIDEVRIYNRALSGTEISALYNNGKVVLNSTKKIYITTPGAGTFSAPVDWPGVADKVEVIGGGAAGGWGSYWANPGSGGGGGAYARKSNVSITNGASLQVGSGGSGGNGAGGGDTWIVSSGTVKAAGAPAHGYDVAGAGGSAGSSVGDLVYSGGSGGSTSNTYSIGGGGGGGAAGPRGAGKNGGYAANLGCCNGGGGAGGGGAGGGSSTAGSDSTNGGPAGTGAAGGTAQDGTAGGAAGGANGSRGSGGGGGGNAAIGGQGGAGVEWDSAHGAGGGGGGGGAGGSSYDGGAGGAGGSYGGGGGGGGQDGHRTPDYNDGGAGGQGIIVITYTPS